MDMNEAIARLIEAIQPIRGQIGRIGTRLVDHAVRGPGVYVAPGMEGAVVGATHPADLATFRNLMPRALLLLPGLGAQGAKAGDLAGAFHSGGTGALASASRAVQYAQGLDVGAAREAAKGLRGELNAALGV